MRPRQEAVRAASPGSSRMKVPAFTMSSHSRSYSSWLAVAPVDLVGLAQRRHLVDPGEQPSVLRGGFCSGGVDAHVAVLSWRLGVRAWAGSCPVTDISPHRAEVHLTRNNRTLPLRAAAGAVKPALRIRPADRRRGGSWLLGSGACRARERPRGTRPDTKQGETRRLPGQPRVTNSACTRRQAAAATTASSMNWVSDWPSHQTASTWALTSGLTRIGGKVAGRIRTMCSQRATRRLSLARSPGRHRDPKAAPIGEREHQRTDGSPTTTTGCSCSASSRRWPEDGICDALKGSRTSGARH